MKATELMIGDWVCLKDDTKCEFPLKVDGVLTNDISLEGEGFLGGVDGLIRPIPLTPEILEKNEWKSDNNISECLGIEVFASEKNKCCVEFDGEDEYSFNTYERWEDTDYYGAPMDWGYRYITSICHLRYVHELQRALRLCGLNELADNFKV